MTEFSARANLDIAVSERSLSDARNQIESRLGSVRAGVTATDGGRASSGLGGGLGDRLGETNDLLVQIRDILDDQAFASAGGGGGGGGTTILGGGGILAKLFGGGAASAGGLALGGLGAAAGGLATVFDPVLKNFVNDLTGGFLEASQTFQNNTLVNLLTNPSNAVQAIGEALGARATEAFVSAARDTGTVLSSVLESSFTSASQSVRSTLSSIDFETPGWVRDLTSLQFDEPAWLSDLRSLFGGGGGGGSSVSLSQGGLGGGENFASGSTSPTVGGGDSTRPGGQVNVSVNASGLQREFQQALSRALRTRDLEDFIVQTVRDEVIG